MAGITMRLSCENSCRTISTSPERMTTSPGPTWPAVKIASPWAKLRASTEPTHPLDLEGIELGKHLVAPSLYNGGRWHHDKPPPESSVFRSYRKIAWTPETASWHISRTELRMKERMAGQGSDGSRCHFTRNVSQFAVRHLDGIEVAEYSAGNVVSRSYRSSDSRVNAVPQMDAAVIHYDHVCVGALERSSFRHRPGNISPVMVPSITIGATIHRDAERPRR